MAIEAELADGRILEFPDGTDPAVIQSTVKKMIAGGSAPAPTAEVAPQEEATPTGAFEALGNAAKPKRQSVLEGRKIPVPSYEDKMLNPDFVAKLQANLDSLPADERQAKLDSLLQRGDVYGRAAKVIAGRYGAMDTGVSPTLKNITDRRLEQQKERFISQGLRAEDAEAMAREQALSGRTRRDLQQMTADLVGEQADKEAAAQAEQYKDAGFWERVGGESKSRATQTGMGLMRIYADMTGDEQMSKDLGSAQRVEEARQGAIPKGESIFEKSAQGAMSSLATQGPMLVLGTLTGTAGPILAQAGIDVFGSEYGQGRSRGLSPAEAATRAGMMATAEVVFERFGLADEMKALKGIVDKMPTEKMAGYLASALAKEVPSEQLTSATQFVIDKAPGIGLNPKAGWKEFLENQGETFRQTILQSGATSAGALGASKAVQGVAKMLPEKPEEREGYERDLSYTGLADMMAREKGFLTPEAKTTQPPATPSATPAATPVAPTTEAVKEEKIAALADRIASRGIDPDDALRMARLQVASDEQKKLAAEEEAAAELPTYYPKEKNNRENAIFLELVDKGVPPEQAKVMAAEQFAAEKEDRKIAAAQTRYLKKAKTDAATQGTTTGVTDVGQPIDQTGGVSPELAGQPDQITTPTGVGGIETSGVVPAGEDVGGAGEGAGAEPGALGLYDRLGLPEGPARENAENEALELDDAKLLKKMIVKTVDDGLAAGKTRQQIAAQLEALTKGGIKNADMHRIHDYMTERGVKEETPQEGAQVGTETIEAVQAEAQGQEPAPAAEPVKGKRGRKPLSAEQRTVAEQKRRQQRIDFNATNRQVGKLEDALNTAITPLDEGEFTAEGLQTAQEEQRRNKNATIRALYDISKTNKGAPGKRAAELLKNPAITPRELKDAADSYDLRKKQGLVSKNAMAGMPAAQPDAGFNKVTNGAQAITRILKTGNAFEKLVAARIRSFVGNVRVVVLQEGDALPEQLRSEKNGKAWEGARGLFIENDATGDRVVYLRGDSFGEDQGVNNVTVLHELLHAATNQKLYLGLTALKQRFSTDAALTKATKDLVRTMRNAQDAYLKLKAMGKAPAEIEDLVQSTRGEIFGLPHEFLAYGMTEPKFQKFLMEVQGEEEDTSFFTQFVTAIRDFFRMGDDVTNALTDLVIATDNLLTSKKTADMRFLEEANQKLAQREGGGDRVSQQVKPGTLSKTAQPDTRTQREVMRDVDIAINQVQESRTAEELAKSTSALQLATDPKKLADAAIRMYDSASYESKRVLLNGVTTDFLVEMGSREVPELNNTWKYIQEMHGMTARLMEGAVDPSTVLFNVVDKDPAAMRPLYDLALEATLAEIDPSTDRRSAKLNARYDALTPAAQNAYKAIRDYFVDMASLYSTLLDDQVNELSASAEDKANLMSKLKAIYEVGGNIVPYFSLVRRGNFWLRVAGKGKERQFYMFQTMRERDKVAAELAARRNSTVEELQDSKDFEIGNDIRSLRLDSYDTSAPKLTAVFDAVDNMKLAGADAKEVDEAKNKLKDAIYQMYLMSLPDQTFRKKFISREGITGFTTDLLQNFSDTATTMSVQLSRIKYGRKIRNSLLAARKSIENRPDLLPYTEEMGTRVALELPTNYDESKVNSYMDAAANFGTRAAFLYFLSGVSSALLQPISVVQFGIPLLGARHGYGATMAEFVKLLKVWNAYGITRKNSDGSTSYIMPTMRNSGAITLDPVEKRAMDHMIGRNVGQITLSGELMARKVAPTEKTVSKPRRIAKGVWWGATGALMQTAERLAQEAVFLTSFRLSRRNAKNKFRKSNAFKGSTNRGEAMAEFEKKNFQRWVDQAVIDTHESLGNMTTENRPPIMRNPAGKLALQFNMFPLHNYIMLGKNGMKMIGLMDAKDRGEAAKTFWGQMGMTALLAGAAGVPGVYMMIGFLSGMWRDNRDKLPADLRELDFPTWFRQKFLPEQLGNEWARLVDRGILNYATGADFASRLSLSNMWFREGKETKTEREGLSQWLTEHMGATVSQALTYADAMDAFKKGDYRTGIEKIAPAFIRNWMFMEKQRTEGAKDSKGAQLLSKDEITTGELIWRAVGFNSDALSDLQTNNFKVIGIQQKIDNERGRILERLDLHLRNNNMREYKKAWDDMEKFNTKYPWQAIEDVSGSIEKKQEQRGMSWRGVQVTEKNAPYAAEALKKSRLDARKKE